MPLPPQDIAFLKAQGYTDWQIANATPSSNSSNGVIAPTLKAYAGGILGGGGGAIGGSILGALAGSEVPVVGNVIGGIAGGILGSLGGSAAGQKLQEAAMNPDAYAALQQQAGQAAQQHPIEAGATDIIASGLASGGLPSVSGGVKGISQILGKLAGRELGEEGKGVLLNAAINPAINTGISLATGQGLPSGSDLTSQILGGALFNKSWLPHGSSDPQIDEPSQDPNEKMESTLPELEAPRQPKLLGTGSDYEPNFTRPDRYKNAIDVEAETTTTYNQPDTIKGLLNAPALEHGDEVNATMENGTKVNGYVNGHSPQGNPLVLNPDTSETTELPEQQHMMMLNNLFQEVNDKGLTRPNEVRKEYPELNLSIQDAYKVLKGAKNYANTKQSPVETIRSETPRPTPQVATGESGGLPETSRAPSSKEKGLPTPEQEQLQRELEEERVKQGMINRPPVPYGFWVSPSGDMHPVTSVNHEEGHAEVARRILKDKYQTEPPQGIIPATQGLLDKGWTRILNDRGQNLMMAESGPRSKALTNGQKRSIRDYAIENGLNAYHLPGGYGREVWIHQQPDDAIHQSALSDWNRYQELTRSLKGKSLDEAAPIAKEIESIKNKYGGKLPPQVPEGHVLNSNLLTYHMLQNKATAGSVLHSLANEQGHPFKELASELLRIGDKKGLGVRIVQGVEAGQRSHYDSESNEIRLEPGDTNDTRIVLEEIVHALTARKLPTFNRVGAAHLEELEHYLKTGDNESVKDLIRSYIETADKQGWHDDLFKISTEEPFGGRGTANAADRTVEKGIPYGMGNLHEFIAQSFKEPSFQRMLDNIQTKDGRTIFQKVVDAVKGLLGLSPKAGSMLERVLRSSGELISQERSKDTEHYEPYRTNAPPKEESKTVSKDKYLGSFGRAFRAVTDKIRDIGTPKSEKLAGAFKEALNRRDELIGKWKNPPVRLGRTLTGVQRNRVQAAIEHELATKTSGIHLLQSAKEREFHNLLRQKYDESAQHQLKVGEPITQAIKGPGGKTIYVKRSLRQDPFYHAGMTNHRVTNTYRKGTDVGAIAQLDKQFSDYNQKVLGLSPDDSAKRIANFKSAMAGSPAQANMSHQDWFNARRKAAGTPLPPSFREQDPVRNAERYFDRAATDASHYEYLERDPEILGALGQTHDAWGNKVDEKYLDHSLYNNPSVKAALHTWTGEQRNPAQEVEEKISALASSIFISGPALEAHKLVSNFVKAATYAENPVLLIRALGHAITNITKGYTHAVEGNVMKLSAVSASRMFDSTATAAEKIQAVGRAVRQVATLGDLTSKFNAGLLQGMMEVIVPSKILRAQSGDVTAQRFLENLDPTYKQGKAYSSDEMNTLASRAANYIHGTGDIRSLPAWMLNDSEFSGFFSLAHWSIAQTNSFMKDVYEPALRGDIKPLLIGIFGASLGGYLIKELRQDISGKKNPIPSLSEIAASSKGLEGNPGLLAYNMIAAMQYSGFGGLLSQIAKYPFDASYKNTPQGATFPLDEVASDLGSTLHQVQEAIANDPNINWIDLAGQVTNHILQTDMQLSRVALNQAIDSGAISGLPAEKKELADKLGQLRRFDMAEGLPYQDIDESQNPYMNIEQRRFKLEQNPQEALKELPSLVNNIIQTYHSQPDVMMSKLKGLKQNSYSTFLSPSEMPISFVKYVAYLNRQEGSDAAQAAVKDYFTHRAINELKGSAVP